jgi:hypothetical protein
MKNDESKMTRDYEEDIGGALVDSLLKPSVAAHAGALLDVAFSKMTAAAIFSEIPVLDMFGRVYGIFNSVRDDLFLRTIVRFLKGCGNLTEEEKAKFQKQLKTDPASRRRAGENLLLILDRLDNFEKAELIGKVFAAKVRGEIDEDMFYRLATVITNASIVDLKNLGLSYEKIADEKRGIPVAKRLDDATSQSLYNAGLVRASGFAETEYLHNELGSTLVRLMK